MSAEAPPAERIAGASFPLWGGQAIVQVTDEAALRRARAEVEDVIERFDLACSRFRADSELSRLNASAGTAVEVGPLLLQATQAALHAAQATTGAVDPTVGQALIALGYDRDFAAIQAQAQRPRISIAALAGWRAVQVDVERSTIRLPQSVTLDLGASAKALAADLAAAQAHEATRCGVLVALGGDVAMGGEAPAAGWRIRVTDDHRAGVDVPGQWISQRTGGLATSSTVARRWRAGDREVHHLVDPATGAPAPEVWRTASVAAASCLDANTASTAAIVRGEQAVDWLREVGMPSRLVSANGTALHLNGWPADAEELPPWS